jgi:hypothetical protein
VARSRSNVERIRRPLTIRHLLRAVALLTATVGGVVVAWVITPRGDVLAFDAGLVRGALLGAVIGLAVAALIPLRDAPAQVVRPRPSGFDALRAELEAPLPARTGPTPRAPPSRAPPSRRPPSRSPGSRRTRSRAPESAGER